MSCSITRLSTLVLVALSLCACEDDDPEQQAGQPCVSSAHSDLAWSLGTSASWGGPRGVFGDAAALGDDAVFVAGTFAGAVDLDPGPGERPAEGTPEGEGLGTGVHVSKLGLDGELLWAAHVQGTRGDGERVRLALGTAGEVYLAGVFTRPVDFDPGPGEDLRDPDGRASFVMRLEADGSYAWTRTWPHPKIYGGVPWVLIDSAGSPWAILDSGAERLEPSTGASTDLVAYVGAGGEVLGAAMREDDVFVIARDAVYTVENPTVPAAIEGYQLLDVGGEGVLAWRYDLATPKLDALTTVGLDTVAAGNLYGDPGESDAIDHAQSDLQPTYGHRDAYVLRLDAAGERVSSASVGGRGEDVIHTLSAGPDGTVFAAGSFYRTLHRTDGSAAFDARDRDAFLIQLDAEANTLGVRTWGGSGEDEAFSAAWSSALGLWVLGIFDGQVDASAGAAPALHSSAGHSDALLLGLSPGEVETGGNACGADDAPTCGRETDARLSGTMLPPHFDACMVLAATDEDSYSIVNADGSSTCTYVVSEADDLERFDQCRDAGGGLIALEPGQACKIIYDECDGPCFGNGCD